MKKAKSMCPLGEAPLVLFCLIALAGSENAQWDESVPVRTGGRSGTEVRLSAFGRHFIMRLTRDRSFLAPSVSARRLSAALRRDEGSPWRDCFYTGTVVPGGHSAVAVSLCGGMRGWFVADGGEYFIEPKAPGAQVHVVTRRTRDSTSAWEEEDDEEGTNAQRRVRKKRFVSAARYVETLVVADASMARFYKADIQHYLLTVMGVAAQLYKHPSLKNSVSLVVVKMLVVEDEELGPTISSNGDLTLRNFCAWQQMFNPSSQRHAEHYDTAIFFTREDICGHQSCDTLGVADVGTVCDPRRSCSIIEDSGLQAAFTVAHELG